MSIIILFENYIVNPIPLMNVWLGSVEPPVSGLTVLTPLLSHDWCMVRTAPPLSLSQLAGIVGLLSGSSAIIHQYPESLSHGPVGV
jgi:hypothetical protein